MTDAALQTTPSGLSCKDAALMRMAYRVCDLLVEERLDEAACEVRKLLAAYPDHLWSHELHEAYLLYARDLFPPENRLSRSAFLAAHIHTLERMLALNPKDEADVYFDEGRGSLRYQLALAYSDAAWEATSLHEAQHAAAKCQLHGMQWADGGGDGPHQSVRIDAANMANAVCLAVMEAWQRANGAPPLEQDKKSTIDDLSYYLYFANRWPWKAGCVPDTTPNRARCADQHLLRLAYATQEAISTGRMGKAERLLNALQTSYPDGVWTYELYDLYLSRRGNKFDKADLGQGARRDEKIRNFKKLLALNPQSERAYFQADFPDIRYKLAVEYAHACFDASTEHEARAMQAACVNQADDWLCAAPANADWMPERSVMLPCQASALALPHFLVGASMGSTHGVPEISGCASSKATLASILA